MFRRTYCLHFQGGTVSQARKQHKQGQIQLIYTVFLGLHFDPEDGGNTIFCLQTSLRLHDIMFLEMLCFATDTLFIIVLFG